MTDSDSDIIFSIIRCHRGSENAITAVDIQREMGLSERNIRKVIAKESHEWPEIVCARVGDPTGAGGYFIPETFEEIEAYWAYLSDLASKSEAKVQRFEQACAKAGFALRHSLGDGGKLKEAAG